MRSPDAVQRDHLARLLAWRRAHTSFDDAVADLPADLRGRRPEGLPHSAWELLEHMRITQFDILDFCRNSAYEQRAWPDDYWPATPAPPAPDAWDASVAAFRADREAMQALVYDPSTNLPAPVPHGGRHTILEQTLILADHNAYHVGQLVLLRRLLGCWPPQA